MHLSVDTARLVITISGRIPTEVAFDGVDDEAALLASHLRRMTNASMPAVIMTGIAGMLRTLPPALASAVVGLFGWMPIPHRVADFVGVVGMERRSIERALRRSGFRGASPVLMTARLARTWSDLEDPSARASTVALRSGFLSARTLADQYRRVLGLPPRAARAQLSPDAFARRLIRAMVE
jgi:transcriptional regulator GlxA family with amidase domain